MLTTLNGFIYAQKHYTIKVKNSVLDPSHTIRTVER